MTAKIQKDEFLASKHSIATLQSTTVISSSFASLSKLFRLIESVLGKPLNTIVFTSFSCGLKRRNLYNFYNLGKYLFTYLICSSDDFTNLESIFFFKLEEVFLEKKLLIKPCAKRSSRSKRNQLFFVQTCGELVNQL